MSAKTAAPHRASSSQNRQRAHALLDHLAQQPPFDQIALREGAAQALALAVEAGDLVLQAEALLAGASWPGQLVDPLGAWSALQRAERIFRANGIPDRAAACQVAMARALYDLGQERQADVVVQAALQEPSLPAPQRTRAYMLRFLALGRMGQIEAAYECLVDQAMPMARASGDGYQLARAIGRKAWLIARLMHSAGNPELPLPAFAHLTKLKREPATLAHVLSLLDEARAALPAGTRWAEIEITHHYALGLTRRPAAVAAAWQALSVLAQEVTATDPPLAAWAYLCAAMVLHAGGDVAGALAVLPQALRVAESARLTVMVRDVLFYQSLCFEAAGDLGAALAAYKRHYALIMNPAESTGPDDPRVPVDVEPQLPGDAAAEPLHRLRALEPACLKRALRLIELRVAENLSANEVVAACGVSRRTLDEAFKAARGTTLLAYLKRKKLEFAANLLLHTQRPIRDIAASMGYRSAALFASEFRDRMGMLPSQWRGLQATPVAPAADPSST
ncbi:MAG TPA: helix-turn-helix transcriptional regulator [Ideonella sp.]|uniref:helix-turn-helix transcriptional regulator n=1 Tax=Ideonella sp. TaxID=1929293 RepID=UPI002C54C2CE|nr:helix-turn-helix transcriptional regulator [Ideonella sp.]HSI50445.1 helix-turn-helix transcriptional regulator [Ideonella sp.]